MMCCRDAADKAVADAVDGFAGDVKRILGKDTPK
jgi:hypothetical protein